MIPVEGRYPSLHWTKAFLAEWLNTTPCTGASGWLQLTRKKEESVYDIDKEPENNDET